jgi:hypothetical protein
MDITVTFQEGRWVTDPNPAIVAIGTKVRWIVRAPRSEIQRLRWTIKFAARSPFHGDSQSLNLETNNTHLGRNGANLFREFVQRLRDLGLTEDALVDHRGTTPAQPTEEPGQYKYDLRVENAENDELVGGEDPVLIVIRPFTIWF